MNKNKVVTSNLWYKEPWPWVIIIMICFIVLFSLGLVWVSLHVSNDLVYDDYYKKGKNIFKQLNKENKAKQLKISAKLFIQNDMRTIQLIMKGNYDINAKLKLQFIHPVSKIEDKEIVLTQSKENTRFYTGVFANRLAFINHWYIHLYDLSGNWIIRGKWISSQGNFVLLEPTLEKYNN